MKRIYNKKYQYGLVALAVFLLGVYLWNMFNKDYFRFPFEGSDQKKIGFGHQNTLLLVGDIKIQQEDIDWEVKLHLAGTLLSPSIERKDSALFPLKERLMASLVERKLLYKFIQQDNRMNLSDPSLYIECMNEWQNTLREATEISFSQKDKEKLKNYLCEKSLIDQYLEKFVFGEISVDEKSIVEFYKNHIDEYKKPKRVIIRQIVLASESEAKGLSGKLNMSNFADYATQVSISPESEKGGKLGPFSRGEMPQVFDVAFSMGPGKISPIIKSNYGFHIIMLEKVLSDNVATLQEVHREIERVLIRDMREQEYKRLVELALDSVHVGSPKPLL